MDFTYYIDMHIHMLPDVDDGPQDDYNALDMMKMAYDDGTRILILTPHFQGGYMESSYEFNEEAFAKLKYTVSGLFPHVRMYLGNEIFYFDSCVEWLDKKLLHTMAGSRYVLIEFAEDINERKIKDAVKNLRLADYIPIIAHAERYNVLVDDVDLVYDLIDLGVYIQINTEALMGDMGYKIKKFVLKLLKNDAVHFIASDAHSTTDREPGLSASYRYVAKKFGVGQANRLFYDNQLKIIQNETI